MAIYTKTGDKGVTGLIGGKRVPKSDPVICALGDLDELNAWMGVLRVCAKKHEKRRFKARSLCSRVQDDISLICAELADARPIKIRRPPRISKKHVKTLERYINDLEKRLPPLKKFLTPGGKTQFQAFAHVARTVCRRAERSTAGLNQQLNINPHILAYINRLSDLLFILSCPL